MVKKSVTSYDVAKAAGVSQSAVSRAFSAKAPIAPKTRQHIRKIAAELGYQPNAIARSMSAARNDPNQRSGITGLIVTRPEDPFFSESIAMISRSLQARGWQVMLFTVDSEAEVDAALNALLQFKVDGVMILSAILSGKMAAACRDQGIPVLLFNRQAGDTAVSSVLVDNREGGAMAAACLLEAGHRRIAFLGGDAQDATSREREEGFREGLSAAGSELFCREYGDYTFDGGAEAAMRLFSRATKPDAVFCASDVMALGVLHTARNRLDLDVPRDFSLLGFDDIPSAAWPGHGLSTIRQPVGRMIRQAVELLVERMSDPDLEARTSLFSGTLILRGTVAPPNRG